VIVGSHDGAVYAWDGSTGLKEWEFQTGDWVFSSPAVGDINNDGYLEVVFGSRNSWVYAVNASSGIEVWKSKTNGNDIRSSPAIANIDGDNALEVIIGSADNYVYAFDGLDGTVDWKFPTGGNVASSPTVGDINNDDILEIIVGSDDNNVYAIDGFTGGEEWRYKTDSIFDVGNWPALSDIDNDGFIEVIFSTGWGNVYVIDEEVNLPPGIPEIIGPTRVKIDESNTWQFRSNNPDDNNIKYHIDWGDDSDETTICWPSNQSYPVTHTYDRLDYHIITVKAQECPHGQESQINDFIVNVPRCKNIINHPFQKMFFYFINMFPILQIILKGLS